MTILDNDKLESVDNKLENYFGNTLNKHIKKNI